MIYELHLPKVYTIVQLLLTDNEENLSDQQVERINLIKQVGCRWITDCERLLGYWKYGIG